MNSPIFLCLLLLKSFIACSNSNNLKRSSNFPLAISCKKRRVEMYDAESATLSKQSATDAHLATAIEPSKPPSASLSKKNCSDFSIAKLLGLPRSEEQNDSCPEFSASHESLGTVEKAHSSHESFTSAMKAFESFQTSIRTKKKPKKQASPARILKNAANPNSTENFPTSSPVQPTTSKQANSYLENLSPISPNSVDFSIGSNQNNSLCYSSSLNSKQTTKPALSRTKRGFAVIEFSHAILSWSKAAITKKRFQTAFRFYKLNAYLFFGSNSFNDLLIFKYAANTFSLLNKSEAISAKEFRTIAIENIQPLFAIVSELNSHSKPFYYLFGNRSHSSTHLRESLRLPAYFLFTTISYLMQNDECQNFNLFKPLIELTYQRLIMTKSILAENWDFLRIFLAQSFDISEVEKIHIKNPVRFDESTVSFIYNEMRFGTNEAIRKFFAQVWEACKSDCPRKNKTTCLCENSQLIIPSKSSIQSNAFERVARKIYQLKFTELLFTKWKSMESLLKEYSQLKSDFQTIIVDFRRGLFSRNDFESLKNALILLNGLLKNYFSEDVNVLRDFFVELQHFINFKCLHFAYNFCKEPENGSIYRKTFWIIKEISYLLGDSCALLFFQRIELPISNYNKIKSIPDDQLFCLSSLANKVLSFIAQNGQEFGQESAISNELKAYLSNFNYFDCLHENLPNLSGFKYAEFIIELDEILSSNNIKRIDEIFDGEKYKEERKLWLFIPKELYKQSSIEIRRQYLEHFKTFLILYNQ